jgi:TPR repeat protein
MPKRVLAGAAIAIAFASAAVAGPFEDGIAAFKRGDYSAAVKLILPLAEEGDATAQYNLGITYTRGLGVGQDYAEAAKWFLRAARQGAALAQFNLGVLYQSGLGVVQDYTEAAKWYRLAAVRYEPRAQFEIGMKLASGQGVPADYVVAYMWLNLAASQGEANAARNRDIVAASMTPDQIAEAQRLAREWKPKLER